MMDYEQALDIATKAHDGQVRKFSGLPYVTHPIAVADSLHYEDDKIIALLHDVVEDTHLTLLNLHNLGLDEYRSTCVWFLTHLDTQTYTEYIKRVNTSGEEGYDSARRVKIADIKHNMSDLGDGCLKDEYELALHILEG